MYIRIDIYISKITDVQVLFFFIIILVYKIFMQITNVLIYCSVSFSVNFTNEKQRQIKNGLRVKSAAIKCSYD